ncbi:MAG: iron-containing alcohol dehydrogenase [Acidimicrobiia bacterium]
MIAYELGVLPRVIVGQGAIDRLGEIVAGLGGTSVLVVVDQAVAATGYSARAVAALDGLEVVEHAVPAGEPTVASVDAAAGAARRLPGAVVVGIGGGSALDTAKQAAVVAASAEGVSHYLLGANPFAGRRPIVAVPTTSGTGAEVTRTCIVSDGHGRKMWTWGGEMLPDAVILDPTATATMPAHVTASTGLDALVHAIEASTGQRRNAMSAAAASQAITLVVRHLPTAVTSSEDLAARQGMQEAALLAGAAIDSCGTGIAHAIGHALGSLHHVPHGVAVAIGLHAALEWNVQGAPEVFEGVAAAFDRSARELPAALTELFAATGFERAVAGLPDAALDADAIAALMAAPENAPMLQNNCVVPSARERRDLAALTVETWRRSRGGR